MYYWLHDMAGDDEGYWQEHLEIVLAALKNNRQRGNLHLLFIISMYILLHFILFDTKAH